MDDMERLTERQSAGYDLKEMGGAWCDNYCEEQSKATCKDCAIWKAIQKLARYEDLAEQGRLIELPCKVGDTVWSTRGWDNKKISKKIDGKTWYRDIFQHKITKEKFSLYDLDKIGKDVFLTKEEAEAKLEKLKEGVE